jgi:hypothetical protein
VSSARGNPAPVSRTTRRKSQSDPDFPYPQHGQSGSRAVGQQPAEHSSMLKHCPPPPVQSADLAAPEPGKASASTRLGVDVQRWVKGVRAGLGAVQRRLTADRDGYHGGACELALLQSDPDFPRAYPASKSQSDPNFRPQFPLIFHLASGCGSCPVVGADVLHCKTQD